MLKVYNTLTQRLEEFTTREKGKVYMYVCGLTPYDYPHVGHGRSAVVYDVMHRYFEYLGYEVVHISNFTDIDDKIIERSNETGIDYRQLSDTYAEVFLSELEKLNVKRLTAYPRATEHMQEIIDMVKRLVEKGYAYEISDGVYFDISKFDSYGKLSHRDIRDLVSGARVEVNPEKKNPLDFALWKKAKPGEPSWDSPWGKGRPGWHIECSAMSLRYLGNGFDIHGGGDDLIFPHHENEIAQSEACTGQEPFARFWIHNGMVVVGKEKMSKSLKNFFVLHKLLEVYGGEVVRLFFISVSYRKPLNFDVEGLENAKKTYEYLRESYLKLLGSLRKSTGGEFDISEQVAKWRADFENAMNDDFNTPVVIALLFEMFRFLNANIDRVSKSSLDAFGALINDVFRVLGLDRIGQESTFAVGTIKDEIVSVIEMLSKSSSCGKYFVDIDRNLEASDLLLKVVSIREQMRKEKRFSEADLVRDALRDIGVVLEDTKEGTKFKLVMTDDRKKE